MSRTTSGDSAPFDVVGARVLVGVQVVDISRLSTHPVPMTTQGLITVAGQGPKDSNGAGKSSFIAALSLLHADEQWRLASGASGAAELLFTAELAAQEGQWSSVDRGYVIGVFADRGAQTMEEVADSTLTVWLRINRKASHVDIRWTEGLHVPYGSTEAERASSVDKLWDELPASNGRSDFHANRLANVLYGGHVRCVSFLSTSVRSSPTANLLAQPLNDLSPARIFNAIATLTGLDRELEHEQSLRSTEHNHRNNVAQAQRDLENWEQEMAVVEAGIARRAAARDVLGTARAAWQGRCARFLLDGTQRAEEIRGRLTEIDGRLAELRETVDKTDDDIAALKDDGALDAKVREADKRWRELDSSDAELRTKQAVATEKLEELRRTQERLAERARGTDGRDTSSARSEQEQAHSEVEAALAARGAAQAAADAAGRAVRDAMAGHDVATEQLQLLRQADIPAAALVDVVDVAAAERETWEPRLLPYSGGVVVAEGHAEQAHRALTVLPGSLVVLADPPGTNGSGELPGSADERFGLHTFLAALAERAGGSPSVDAAANVTVVGGFAEPITGKPTRVAAAEEKQRQSAEALAAAESVLADARQRHELAVARSSAAQAAEQAEQLHRQVADLRTENEQREWQREGLAPELEQAQTQRTKALAEREIRAERIERLTSSKTQHERTIRQHEEEKNALTEERDGLNLLERERAWGDSPSAAEQYLLSLESGEQQRGTAQWNEDACHHLNDAAHRCFPENTPGEEMPSEIHNLLVEQRWRRGGLDTRVALVPALLRALQTHLRQTEEHDKYQYQQIVNQREQRTSDLNAAKQGLAEAEQTSHAHRTSLAQGIKAKLKQVAEEFNRLDQEYGGYGAGLDYPEPEPPAEPDKPWRWSVTPKWRRAEGQRMSSYSLRSNTAQMDEKAVKLVCAAALGGGGDRPLLLVLDELGRNLGKQHRREAVALFERIGLDRNITVIGALQDDMERYAIEASGLYVKLRRSSDTMAYNEAPVIVGDEANRTRVEMLRDWLGSYHQEPA